MAASLVQKRYRERLGFAERKRRDIKRDLKRHFGITPEQYDSQLLHQKGCCAICGKHQSSFSRRLAVDHDHATEKIRGLLCVLCNTNLAVLEDKEYCMKASIYLRGSL